MRCERIAGWCKAIELNAPVSESKDFIRNYPADKLMATGVATK